MTPFTEHVHALQAAIAALQSQRAVLGDALVDAALAPLLERLATLGAPPQAPARAEPTEPTEPSRRLRQVSVLFLDLVGSTQLIQHLDPEDVQAVVDGALAAFTTIVTQHGGEVLRYAGDNIKAVFGAHDAVGTREDDAERAVHCGLALLAEAARRGEKVKRRGAGLPAARLAQPHQLDHEVAGRLCPCALKHAFCRLASRAATVAARPAGHY